MKKLLLLLAVICCSFAYVNGQTVDASFSTSYGSYGIVTGTGTPAYIKGNCTVSLNAKIYSAIAYEWTLRSGAPNGTYIVSTDKNNASVKIGSATYGWVVLDFIATDNNGLKTYGHYYLCIQG